MCGTPARRAGDQPKPSIGIQPNLLSPFTLTVYTVLILAFPFFLVLCSIMYSPSLLFWSLSLYLFGLIQSFLPIHGSLFLLCLLFCSIYSLHLLSNVFPLFLISYLLCLNLLFRSSTNFLFLLMLFSVGSPFLPNTPKTFLLSYLQRCYYSNLVLVLARMISSGIVLYCSQLLYYDF